MDPDQEREDFLAAEWRRNEATLPGAWGLAIVSVFGIYAAATLDAEMLRTFAFIASGIGLLFGTVMLHDHRRTRTKIAQASLNRDQR